MSADSRSTTRNSSPVSSNLRPYTALSAIALALHPCLGDAAGFALLEQSASRLGTAFAGTAAAADDATTLFFNPAGLMQLNDAQASLVTSGIEISSEFRDRQSAPAFGQPLGTGGGDAGDWNFVPSAYAATPIGERFVAGIGVNAPFGLKLEYDEGWAGRFQALSSEIETLNVNPSLAYRLNERWSVGVGVNYQRLQAELTNAVDYSAVVAQGVQQLVAGGQLPPAAVPGTLAATTGLEGAARVRGDDAGWGFNVGLLYELTDQARLGLSYRSQIDFDVRGTTRFTAPQTLNTIGAGIIAQAAVPGAALSNGPVSVDLTVPDSAIFSLQYAPTERTRLLADVAWTGWSTVQELRVVRDSGAVVSLTPERWRDSWRYALGATYSLSQQVLLRAGVAYDETPVPDATRTPRLPDSDRTWLAIGARWSRGPLTLDFGFAHLFAESVSLNVDGGNAAASGVLNGEQSADVEVLSTQLAYRF
jgi:long-chain fatty acid transport protein